MASLVKRGNIYYAQYMKGGKAKRVSLETSSLQIAKEKVRKIESSFYRGDDIPLPTKTQIAEVVTAYIEYMRIRKTARRGEIRPVGCYIIPTGAHSKPVTPIKPCWPNSAWSAA